MASLQLGLHTGGSGWRRLHARSGGRPAAAAAAVKQLLRRLRSTWRRRRRSAARPRRGAARSFGYDLQSYYQNFDDGLASSGGRRRL
ncbi:hypothetical protein C2845_PM02G12190 [Panicum miliaceum]|uniref:Uncharacterized protein n=1 Tax=Panicum miliaceum TaxID=4540 RepID=A0A3L6SD43_PANMI|nr:hypothetical protein C2845_PM02G12190 [Panicum miliaceum]